ncbi:MAG: hypothetical protein RLY46_40, partial [Bacteroidota bacterium]
PGVPEAVNITGESVNPVDVAVRVFVPAIVPIVQGVDAMPFTPVVTVALITFPPPPITAKDTLTPETGLPLSSVIRTLGAVAKVVPTVAD